MMMMMITIVTTMMTILSPALLTTRNISEMEQNGHHYDMTYRTAPFPTDAGAQYYRYFTR